MDWIHLVTRAVEVVSKILLEGFVAPAEMMLELEKKYVDIFDHQLFLDKLSNAWGVIEDYVKTGCKNVVGGTRF